VDHCVTTRRAAPYGAAVQRELVVLGTSSQVPTRTRNHTGHVLHWDDEVILFDPGEGTQRQMVLAGVSAPSLHRICLTHAHGDHCLGLPGVLARRALDHAARPVVLHYPAAAQADVDALRRAGAPNGTGDALERPVLADGVVAETTAWRLVALALDHRVPAVGYRLEERDTRRMLPERLAAFGVRGPDVGVLQRVGHLDVGGRRLRLDEVSEPRRGQVFAFVMDTRWCAGAVALAQGADLLVVEATFLHRDADIAASYGHLTARQAGELAAQGGVRRLVLTHFSQRYGDDAAPFVAEAAAVFDGEIVGARDLDRVEVPERA
jgi:ribonuclease Z